jgi:hypothetical protein
MKKGGSGEGDQSPTIPSRTYKIGSRSLRLDDPQHYINLTSQQQLEDEASQRRHHEDNRVAWAGGVSVACPSAQASTCSPNATVRPTTTPDTQLVYSVGPLDLH